MTQVEMIEKAEEICESIPFRKCGEKCPYFVCDDYGECKAMIDRSDEELKAIIDSQKSNEIMAEQPEKPDMVNKPNHYMLECGKDCFDVMIELFGKEAVQTYCVLNAFTYLWRHARKNGTEDVLKAEYNLAKFKELEIGRIFE